MERPSAARQSGRGRKPKPVVEFPVALFEVDGEPAAFDEALAMQMRRHGDSCGHLCKAVVRPRDRFDRRTLFDWITGGCVPQTALSMAILGRIERRYRLPFGYFKALLPHTSRAISRPPINGISAAEQRRLAWHLPDDFGSRPPAARADILAWVRSNILAGQTAYRRFQAEACKHRYALRFEATALGDRRPSERTGSSALRVPVNLQQEMNSLLNFKTATLTRVGLRRSGVWCDETANQRTEHLSLLFGALHASRSGPVVGLGVPLAKLSFALLVFPSVWDWYLNWRAERRGFFTAWEVDMLRLAISLCRAETGWLRQSSNLAARLQPICVVSEKEVRAAQGHWDKVCDHLCDYARSRVREVDRVARVHRDPFEPILPILESESPVAAYRMITEEIEKRIPDSGRYPVAAAEAVRAFLMLRFGLHLGVRQRNLRELLLCKPGDSPRSERELEMLRRGELKWLNHDSRWEVFIPSAAFKNSRSSFFKGRPFRLTLPDLGKLYHHLDAYVRKHRSVLLNDGSDPGTLFVKTVKRTTRNAAYDAGTFYEAWRLAIQRYGIWNPYTGRGAIRGLMPHGPHSVRDVLATHMLKKTGSYEQASYAIQDTVATVAAHYGRFLPHDKAAMAALTLNEAWA